MTGTYFINNNRLPSPTMAKWIEPEVRAENGAGVERYNKYLGYEITWDRLSYPEFNGLNNVWKGHYNSGSAVVNLPQYQGTQWYFQEYSGTIVDRPKFARYNNTYYQDVRIVIRKITV